MKNPRGKDKKRGAGDLSAARIGLKPPGGGRLKWVRVGFAWDLFVLAPLFGLPLFWRKLPQWGAVMLALLLADVLLGLFLSGRALNLAGIALAGVYFLLDLFLGVWGNRLTARAYVRHGWSVDHPEYAATRKIVQRWKLGD
ncbi:MAG TPA: hypothetical protein VFC38_08660 [Stellaceae bacterium]|nr:hypothetical protein [Stellaceae bacterium]